MGFRIISSAFRNNEYIPQWYSRTGGDISPPIGWTKPPSKTRSISLIVTCTDEDEGKEYCHWVMYNIPPRERTIFGNRPRKNESQHGTMQGVNSFGGIGWDGPDDCIPEQELVFTLYALDTRLDLPGGASHHDVEDAMQDHILQKAILVGRYSPS